MSTPTWQSILERGQQTVGVWTQFAPAFVVDDLTLALHEADVNALAPLGLVAEQKQDAADDVRAARDASMGIIRDFGTRMARKLDGDLSPSDPFHGDLEDIRTVAFESIKGALSRGQKTVSLWEKYNARRAAAIPPKAALTVGGKTLAQYKTETDGLPGRMLAVEKADSVLRDARSDLRVLAARMDVNNKRWYASWSGEFAAGSPERAALGQITTGSSGGGEDEGGGGGGAEVPAAAVLNDPAAFGPNGVELSFSAEGATGFDIYQQQPGGADLDLLEENFVGTTRTVTSLTSGLHRFQVAGRNAAGVGPRSEVKEFTIE